MKKFALALASMLLVLSAAGAAAAVPSKTTTDVTRVKAVESTEPTMLIEVTEDDAPVVEEIEKIYQHVAVKGQAAIAYFPVETQNEIIALLPEGVKGSALTMNEFVTLTTEGTAADVKVTYHIHYPLYCGSEGCRCDWPVRWHPRCEWSVQC